MHYWIDVHMSVNYGCKLVASAKMSLIHYIKKDKNVKIIVVF